ncbi:MAG TPA: Uma2 family endonuclease [Yinghuangia sp.]|uniref:Uma2 family endonuclease n=1 Tax=Yinghuangia sp. YIM S10712 TaxID=3436930 RepID=UPI002BF24335|nr:Uma2 family endonuclease [Yinghuangia sp.]
MTAELDLFYAPPHGGWTVDDLPAVARTTDRRFELLDGSIIVMSPQTVFHARVKRRLRDVLATQAPGGMDVELEMAVQITRKSAPEPDVLIYRDDYDDEEALISFEDVVLAVEIVSNESEERDRFTKAFRYAVAKIPYYWRIERYKDDDKRLRAEIHAYELDTSAGKYVPAAPPERERLVVDLGFPVEVDVKALYP